MSTQRLDAKSLDNPDETRLLTDTGKVDIVKLGEVTVGRGVSSRGGAGPTTGGPSPAPPPVRPPTPDTSCPVE
jgi:hypothetical protein